VCRLCHCARQRNKDARSRGRVVATRWLRAAMAHAWCKWRALHETKRRLVRACDKIVRRWRLGPLSMCLVEWYERVRKMRRVVLHLRNSKLAAGWRLWSDNVRELGRRTRLLAKACNRVFIKHRRSLSLALEVVPAQLQPVLPTLESRFSTNNPYLFASASTSLSSLAFRVGEKVWRSADMRRASCEKWWYAS